VPHAQPQATNIPAKSKSPKTLLLQATATPAGKTIPITKYSKSQILNLAKQNETASHNVVMLAAKP